MKEHDQDREKDRQQETLPGLAKCGIPKRGGLDRAMALSLSVVVSVGVLALLRTMSLEIFGQSHRHHVGRCSSVHPREEAEREE